MQSPREKTFTHIGLRETQTIFDSKNPETVYIAALGHPFGPNPDRGVFKIWLLR